MIPIGIEVIILVIFLIFFLSFLVAVMAGKIRMSRETTGRIASAGILVVSLLMADIFLGHGGKESSASFVVTDGFEAQVAADTSVAGIYDVAEKMYGGGEMVVNMSGIEYDVHVFCRRSDTAGCMEAYIVSVVDAWPRRDGFHDLWRYATLEVREAGFFIDPDPRGPEIPLHELREVLRAWVGMVMETTST